MENILSFIVSPPFTFWFLGLQLAFILVSIAIIVATIFLFVRTQWIQWVIGQDLVEFFTYRPYGIRKLLGAWNKIAVRLETGLESEYRLAVIEADSLLDDVLRRIGIGGQNLTERFKNLTTAILPNLEDLKKGNEVRNSIVRDPNFTLSLDQARRTMAVYEQALRDLQVLD